MNHEQWALLSAYLDGELSPGERDSVEAHLAECQPCRAEAEALRETKAWAAAAPRRPLPQDLAARFEKRFASHGYKDILITWLGRPRVWVPAGALVSAILLVTIWLGLRRSARDKYVPLELLLAAHSRYAAEGLVTGDPVAENFSFQLAAYHEEQD